MKPFFTASQGIGTYTITDCRLPCLVAVALLLSMMPGSASVIRVKTDGSDLNNGSSWALPKHSISNALANALSGDQIWIAAGTYLENLVITNGIELYGGFSGTETTLAQRNWRANFSAVNGQGLNSVIRISTFATEARIDGLVIYYGRAIYGGGISAVASSPVIANNQLFYNVSLSGAGGGIYLSGSSTTSGRQAVITNNVVYQNWAYGNPVANGAGIALVGASPLIAWNYIVQNSAGASGGGIGCWNACQATIANNYIVGNSASCSVQVQGMGGGIHATAENLDGTFSPDISAPLILNNLVAANGAASGGGICLHDSELRGATVKNNTIVGNTGGGIINDRTPSKISNNLVAYNSEGISVAGVKPTLSNNDTYGNFMLGSLYNYPGIADPTGTAGNISADPALANYLIGNCRLQPASPCRDAGTTDSDVLAWPDLDGVPRADGVIDIGAYESTGAVLNVPTPVVRVSPSGSNGDGSTWATAKTTVGAAIATLSGMGLQGGQVWIAQGTYHEHLALPAFIALYGGFAGTENDLSQRSIGAHPGVLDGSGAPGTVMCQNGGYLLSRLDGLTLQHGGTYTGADILTTGQAGSGGAIAAYVTAPVIANSLICSNSLGGHWNTTNSYGGGFYGYLSHALITNNTFLRNEVLNYASSMGEGGGLYFSLSNPTLDGNRFISNACQHGSAVFVDLSCRTVLSHNLIQSNWMYGFNTADGAVTIGQGTAAIVGNTFQGNAGGNGAGLNVALDVGTVCYNIFLNNHALYGINFTDGGGLTGLFLGTGPVAINNNTFYGNTVQPTGYGDNSGAMSLEINSTNKVVVANNIIAHNSGGISVESGSQMPVMLNNCYNGNTHGDLFINNVNSSIEASALSLDPQFANAATGDFHLLSSSPCIDAGTNLTYQPYRLDYDGTPGPLDGKNTGIARFDVGAFEYVHPQADTDHDGAPDASELIAGTDPTSASSVLKLAARHLAAPNGVALTWPSVAGRTYSVLCTTNLTS